MAEPAGAEQAVPATRTREQIPALTGLRAIAAWMVWLRHSEIHSEIQPHEPGFLTRLSVEGRVGVSVFFVLSGFLIALRYIDAIRLDRPWFRDYLTNRFARIYPVYFAVTLVVLVIFRASPLMWVTSLTLTGGFVYPPHLVVGVAWSLVVEECFYLTAPFLFLAMRRGFVAGFVLPLCLAYAVVVAIAAGDFPSLERFWDVVRFSYPGRFLEFLLGAWAALLLLRGRLHARSGLWTYGGIAAFAVTMLVLVLRQDPGVSSYHSEGALLSKLIGSYILPWGIVLLVIGLALERTLVSRVLGHPVLVLCGRASYVFYLIHYGALSGALPKYLGLTGVSQFVAVNLIAIAAHRFYEEPMRNLVRNYWGARKPALAGA
jgi:peptidoglycan/LPS O-acetylase OafA/YrhL